MPTLTDSQQKKFDKIYAEYRSFLDEVFSAGARDNKALQNILHGIYKKVRRLTKHESLLLTINPMILDAQGNMLSDFQAFDQFVAGMLVPEFDGIYKDLCDDD